MNIPDVPVAINAEGLSHVPVQPAIQEEEKGNTLPAVRILFFFNTVLSTAIFFVLWEPSLRNY